MINNNQITSDKAEILKEIFLVPSKETVPDRFTNSDETQAGNCSGRCGSGVCRTFV